MAALYANFCYGHAKEMMGLATPDASPARGCVFRISFSIYVFIYIIMKGGDCNRRIYFFERETVFLHSTGENLAQEFYIPKTLNNQPH